MRIASLFGKIALPSNLRSRVTKRPLVPTQPSAPAWVHWDSSALHEPSRRFFEMTSVAENLFSISKLVDFEYRSSVLELLAQAYEPVGSQSASATRFGHLRCVIDAVHPRVGALQHHEAAAGPLDRKSTL